MQHPSPKSLIAEESFDPEAIHRVFNEPKCIHCETKFKDRTPESVEEISVHLGEFQFEMDLQVEQVKFFHVGKNKCEECKAEVTGDYVQREHIMLQHPWPVLKATVEKIVQEVTQDDEDITDNQFETTVDEATKLMLQKELDGLENTQLETASTMLNETLQNIEEFIKNLNSNSLNPYPHKISESPPSSTTICLKPSEGASVASLKNSSVENQISWSLSPQISASLSATASRTTVVCSMCSKTWTNSFETRMSDLKSRIKSHLIELHLETKLNILHKNQFNGNICKICNKNFTTSDIQKKHIQRSHKLLDSKVMPILGSILGKDIDKKDPFKTSKRKGSPLSESILSKLLRMENNDTPANVYTSDIDDLLQDSPLKDAKSSLDVEDSSDFREIQSNLEFSDSEDEDPVEKDENISEIQQGIEFSDSEEEDD